jgi:predicted transcriptional regulator
MAQPKSERYTAQQVADALTATHGFVTAAAKSLGMSDQAVRNYMKKYDVVKQACDDARERMIDYAEGALYKKIQEGDTACIIFFLKTQARKRGNGYSERAEMEVSGRDGDAVRLQIEYVNDWRAVSGLSLTEDANQSSGKAQGK